MSKRKLTKLKVQGPAELVALFERSKDEGGLIRMFRIALQDTRIGAGSGFIVESLLVGPDDTEDARDKGFRNTVPEAIKVAGHLVSRFYAARILQLRAIAEEMGFTFEIPEVSLEVDSVGTPKDKLTIDVTKHPETPS